MDRQMVIINLSFQNRFSHKGAQGIGFTFQIPGLVILLWTIHAISQSHTVHLQIDLFEDWIPALLLYPD